MLFLKRGERAHLEQEQKFEKKKFAQYDLFTIQKKNISEFQKVKKNFFFIFFKKTEIVF